MEQPFIPPAYRQWVNTEEYVKRFSNPLTFHNIKLVCPSQSTYNVPNNYATRILHVAHYAKLTARMLNRLFTNQSIRYCDAYNLFACGYKHSANFATVSLYSHLASLHQNLMFNWRVMIRNNLCFFYHLEMQAVYTLVDSST